MTAAQDALSTAPTRARAWNAVMCARPGDLDLRVEASRIEGALPAALRGGRLLSNGPGWTRIGGRLAHPFDGHGYLREFAFQPDGSLRLRARFVQTPAYQSEARAQRITHRGLATNLGDRFWQNYKTSEGVRHVANTTVVPWRGRLLLGWEGGAPYAMDADSLETLGEETFGGALAGEATLAHMKHDAALGRLVTCGVKMGRTTTLTLREFDADGALVDTRVATMPAMLFAHDFVVTPHWYLLAGNPLKLKPLEFAKAMAGASTLLDAIRTDPSAPGVVHMIPRGREGAVRTVTLPGGAFVVHYGAAFERDGAVHLDACLFERFEFGGEFGFRGPHADLDPTLPDRREPQRLYRITIADGASRGSWRRLAPHGIDFPRVHPAHEGRETPALFGASRADLRYSDPFDSVVRVDLTDPERPPSLWTAPGDVFVGEPIFAPSPERDDAGHVLVILSDGVETRTTLAVFDASNLSRGPVAQAPLPLLPVAFHGAWDGTARPL